MGQMARWMKKIDSKTVTALQVASVWMIVEVVLYLWSEWLAWHESTDTFVVDGILISVMFVVCTIAFVLSIFKMNFIPAAIYAFIVVATVTGYRNIKPIDMKIKSYFFSAYPQFCPIKHRPGQRTYVCYVYEHNIYAGMNRLVINPGDEMLLPVSQWSQEVIKAFNLANIPQSLSDDDCAYRKTKRMTGHVYWVSDDCSHQALLE